MGKRLFLRPKPDFEIYGTSLEILVSYHQRDHFGTICPEVAKRHLSDKEELPIAKTDRCVVRNQAYRRAEFSIRERHNERKNESYHNGDIIPERLPLNILESNVPHICKNDFDYEAVLFLEQYCPEALEQPMTVPILHIARHKMGLRVVEKRLSEDFSILGQMCFTTGLAEIYDKDKDEYREVKARYGTMIIDPDTIAKRNEGCKNNTVAHECFHWHKHRDYHIAASVIDKTKSSIRSPWEGKSESIKLTWTDEDWMEWQAKGIAPRILMEMQFFKEKEPKSP